MTIGDQLALFAEADSNGPTTRVKGPRGLLLALLEQGLAKDCVAAAAALVVHLDAEPIGDGE